jgi:Leu/Phe-tRNA-protein transferase
VRPKNKSLRQTRKAGARNHNHKALLRVCAWCNRAEQDGRWIKISASLKAIYEEAPTHGICPECERVHFPELSNPLKP